MAEASKISGENYRRIFLEYDPVFVHEVDNRPGGFHGRYDCQRGLKDTEKWKELSRWWRPIPLTELFIYGGD